jgi:hypothetical protein
MGSTITKYVVCEDPDEWGDEPPLDSYQEAKDEAERRCAAVVELTFEYTDSEVVDDFRPEWQVIVGNIGTVYAGRAEMDARENFRVYIEQSTTRWTRAAGENVVLMKDGEIVEEHEGSGEDRESMDSMLEDT